MPVITSDEFRRFSAKHHTGFPRQQDGYVTLSDAPGLGLEAAEAERAAHPPLQRNHARRGSVKEI